MRTTTTTTTTAVAGLLLFGTLALSSPAPAMDQSKLTPAQLDWAENLVIPPCVDKCVSGPALLKEDILSYIPPCSNSILTRDQSTPEDPAQYTKDMITMFGCVCTDRFYVNAIVDCVLDSCASNGRKNATANIEVWMEMWYAQCDFGADVKYPEPKAFVSDLCLKDKFEGKADYPQMADFKKAWSTYEYLADSTWPAAPKPTKSLPADKRKPLPCTVGAADLVVESGTATGTATKTKTGATQTATGTATATGKGSANSTQTGNGAAETGSASTVGMGMGAVAVAIAALAVML